MASETGWPLEKVARYAEPPLGERSYIAEQARAVEISRSRGGSTLHESVCSRLSVDPDTSYVTWDSYRAEDGRWIVTAFHDGGSVGTWVYEVVGRSVHPVDASARALMGAGPTEVTSEPAAAPAGGEARSVQDEAVEVASAVESESSPRPRLVSITSDPTADQSRGLSASDSGEPPADATENSTPTEDPAQGALIPEPSTPKRTKRAKGKKGRASVPSWDEILFGATKDSE